MIEGISGVAAPPSVKRIGLARGGPAFRLEQAPSPEVEMPRSGAGEVSGATLAGMLTIQEQEADNVHDREARRRGSAVLDGLRRLQRDMLLGGVDPHHLTALAELTDDLTGASEPQLQALVAAISLRARIELAKCRIT